MAGQISWQSLIQRDIYVKFIYIYIHTLVSDHDLPVHALYVFANSFVFFFFKNLMCFLTEISHICVRVFISKIIIEREKIAVEAVSNYY